MSQLGALGEFGLIRQLTEGLASSEDVLTGIGDDCAVLRLGDRELLVTCDAAIEDVHFRRALASPQAIGWKSAASALSDIAAMGGQPRFVLITLACPPDTSMDFLEALYRGMAEAVSYCGAVVVGGDTTQSPSGMVIDLTVIGEPVAQRSLLRSGARPRDCLAVTGWPGRSAAGLLALERGDEIPALVQAHLHPLPRIAEGQWLAAQPEVHAAIDLSDGLLQDAGHLAESSQLGIDLHRSAVPIAPELRAFCGKHALDAGNLAFNGGEEYELVLALDGDSAVPLAHGFQERFGLPLTVIGRFTEAWSGMRMEGEALHPQGYDHFRL